MNERLVGGVGGQDNSFHAIEPKKQTEGLTEVENLVLDPEVAELFEEIKKLEHEKSGEELTEEEINELIDRKVELIEKIEDLKNIEDKDAAHNIFSELFDGAIDPLGLYLDINYVAKRLDITTRMLTMMGMRGEIEIGKLGTKTWVSKKSVLDYLNARHFTKRQEDDEGIFPTNHKGRRTDVEPTLTLHKEKLTEIHKGRRTDVEPTLTLHKEKLTEIPQLKSATVFAKFLGCSKRSFTRLCDAGHIDHFRIGTLYKVSVSDFYKHFREEIKK